MPNPRPRLQRFVPRNIATDEWLNQNPDATIECWGCGISVTLDDPRRKFCTRSCRLKYWRKLRKIPNTKYCWWCEVKFHPFRSDTRYCQKKCREEADRSRRGIPMMKKDPRQCEICKQSFFRIRPPQKFCSFKCFLKHRTKYNRAYMKEYEKYGVVVNDKDIVQITQGLLKLAEKSDFNPYQWEKQAREVELRLARKYAK